MSDDKTEEPTPKRLREARERGQVAKSKELGTALLLLATGGALGSAGPGFVTAFRALLEPALAHARGDTDLPPSGAISAVSGARSTHTSNRGAAASSTNAR